ncbi:MAG: hypothetical protein ACRDWD_01360 [Acidimicrobiia bacterium]
MDEPGSATECHDPTAGWVTVIAAGLLAIGSLLQWASVTRAFETISLNGTEGDGQLTLLAAVPIGIVGLRAIRHKSHPGQLVVVLVAAAFAASVCVYNIGNPDGITDESAYLDMSAFFGLWLAAVGWLAATAGALVGLVGRQTRVPGLPPSAPAGDCPQPEIAAPHSG